MEMGTHIIRKSKSSDGKKKEMSYLTLHGAATKFYAEGPRSSAAGNYPDDSGYDLFVPSAMVVPAGARGFRVDHQVRAALRDVYGSPKPFLLVPRSSMGAKTPLRLSNSIGIIDRGYRGPLVALVDNLGTEDYALSEGDRIVQLVQFTGEPVTNVAIGELDATNRGEGGFGSTGR